MAVKARIRSQQGSGDSNGDSERGSPSSYSRRQRRSRHRNDKLVLYRLLLQETRARIVAGILAFLAIVFVFLVLAKRGNADGPPSSLVVVGKRAAYQPVPDEYRRRFYIDDHNSFRRTVIRAFRNRGWRKANEPEEAQFVYDKYCDDPETFDTFLPWQRYSQYPGFDYWEEKDFFVEGFQRYYSNYPEEPHMLPETYILDTKEQQKAFKKRLEEEGGYDEPWVLKIPNKNNGEGITMLGPNSDELRDVFTRVKKYLKKHGDEEDHSRLVAQSYICNELTWYHNHKFDLRFYWMVASVDPLIVLYHDGYVRVGNAAYDESDWSSTRQHLTTHTFLADEEKGTIDQLKSRIREHYHENKQRLSHIRIDPVEHIRNQFKASIAQTAAAFKDVTFGNNEDQQTKSQNAYQFNGADFVIDNNLDIWYVEAQAGPGMEEEWDFRVTMHADLLQSMIDTVEEIQLKQEADPNASLLPLKNRGGWEVVYAGDWQYRYEGYQRPTEKAKCNLAR